MQPPLPPSLVDGKTFVVTGANIGLGFACAQSLVRDGATVIMACRSLDKAHAAKRALPLSEDAAADAAVGKA